MKSLSRKINESLNESNEKPLSFLASKLIWFSNNMKSTGIKKQNLLREYLVDSLAVDSKEANDLIDILTNGDKLDKMSSELTSLLEKMKLSKSLVHNLEPVNESHDFMEGDIVNLIHPKKKDDWDMQIDSVEGNHVKCTTVSGKEVEYNVDKIVSSTVGESVYESYIDLDAMEPNSKEFKALLKKYNVKLKVLNDEGPSGYPEVRLTGSKENLKKILADENGWDDAGLADDIHEGLNESSAFPVNAKLQYRDQLHFKKAFLKSINVEYTGKANNSIAELIYFDNTDMVDANTDKTIFSNALDGTHTYNELSDFIVKHFKIDPKLISNNSKQRKTVVSFKEGLNESKSVEPLQYSEIKKLYKKHFGTEPEINHGIKNKGQIWTEIDFSNYFNNKDFDKFRTELVKYLKSFDSAIYNYQNDTLYVNYLNESLITEKLSAKDLKPHKEYLVKKGKIEAYAEYKSSKDGKHYFDNSGEEIVIDDADLGSQVTNESYVLDIEGDKFSVGDEIKWLNIAINKRRQGIITKLDKESISVDAGRLGNFNIKAPFGNKEIFKLNS